MQIFVDADAFPKDIQEIVFRAVERVRIPLILVSNKNIRHPSSELISKITVAEGPDVADDRIVELVGEGDLVITADIPLASRVVDKNAFAIDPRGELYNKTNIKHRLAMRDLMKELRQEGEIMGGPRAFNGRNVQAFANELDKFLTKHCRKAKE
ncbi:MAG TPA: YaiI/YqxD family protein [Lentisphaeria bacterium]|nr:MAG: hypothetical protein A2X45_02775 [Lentisphaerae bacterium GWF2_50_93]HCE45285.1 YaiI/YqxD family protein [Lentisphaeria bacterium]